MGFVKLHFLHDGFRKQLLAFGKILVACHRRTFFPIKFNALPALNHAIAVSLNE